MSIERYGAEYERIFGRRGAVRPTELSGPTHEAYLRLMQNWAQTVERPDGAYSR